MKLDQLSSNGVAPIHLGGALLCVCLLGAGWFFGMKPLMEKTTEDTTVAEQAEQAQRDADTAKTGLERLRIRLDEVKAELDRQPVSLESAEQINPLLAQLAEWSDTHRLAITQTRAGTPIALMYYDYVPITLTGEGRYGDFLAMLRQLRSSRGDLGVVSFEANRMTTAEGPGLGFTIELAWYVIAEEGGGLEDESGTPATASVEIGL